MANVNYMAPSRNVDAPLSAFAGAQNAAVQPPAPNGSLADAFASMNREVENLEVICKSLWERIQPALEPSTPRPTDPQASQGRPQSLLAEVTFELTRRISSVALGLSDMRERISF